ncbi:MAG TPA: SRPBCC family protein [Acidimicrobiales bacterium]|jgi:uncharacterized protein YndB with AHSA1/START domain|nr:SRPBCC family protein [Acidimicrobiales bacterium]
MPPFSLTEQSADWVASAPIQVIDTVDLAAPPDRVFEVLADTGGWAAWYKGMRKVRIDGAASGVGALRTVWVGATSVQERFVVWEPGQRMTFVITAMNVPGLRSMVEDWVLTPGATAGTTRLTTTIGVEAKAPLRSVPKLVQKLMASATKGSAGLASQFT